MTNSHDECPTLNGERSAVRLRVWLTPPPRWGVDLPQSVQARQPIDTVCGGPIAAAQRFALYLTVPGAQFLALHVDDFHSRTRAVHCRSAGCLHEAYVLKSGRYRRVLVVHAYDVRLSSSRDQAFLEVLGGSGKSRTLRWNGSRFVERWREFLVPGYDGRFLPVIIAFTRFSLCSKLATRTPSTWTTTSPTVRLAKASCISSTHFAPQKVPVVIM